MKAEAFASAHTPHPTPRKNGGERSRNEGGGFRLRAHYDAIGLSVDERKTPQ